MIDIVDIYNDKEEVLPFGKPVLTKETVFFSLILIPFDRKYWQFLELNPR